MDLNESDLREVIETVWVAALGLDVLGPAGSSPPPPTGSLCGCVQITGAFGGAVMVSVSERLARRAAGAMLDTPPEAVTAEDLRDALGEIANMTGGNVKALLPGPSHLSLPSVVSGTAYTVSTPGAVIVQEVTFQVMGERILVHLLEGRPGAAADRRAAP
jgi:chemotaxis protein CheX